jgi:hypothetical protein
MPIEVPILEVDAAPIYQQVATRARHLEELGMRRSQIARGCGVDWKTVVKALAWLDDVKRLRSQFDLNKIYREVEILVSRI